MALSRPVIVAAIGTTQTLAWASSYYVPAILTEPTEMALVIAHRGFVWAEIEVTGRAAHGSLPELGVDAIVKTGPVLTALGCLDGELHARTHPLLGRGSVHASLIAGGEALSSYPARCVVGIERRTLPGESATVANAIGHRPHRAHQAGKTSPSEALFSPRRRRSATLFSRTAQARISAKRSRTSAPAASPADSGS